MNAIRPTLNAGRRSLIEAAKRTTSEGAFLREMLRLADGTAATATASINLDDQRVYGP